jgi:hypothetical protein
LLSSGLIRRAKKALRVSSILRARRVSAGGSLPPWCCGSLCSSPNSASNQSSVCVLCTLCSFRLLVPLRGAAARLFDAADAGVLVLTRAHAFGPERRVPWRASPRRIASARASWPRNTRGRPLSSVPPAPPPPGDAPCDAPCSGCVAPHSRLTSRGRPGAAGRRVRPPAWGLPRHHVLRCGVSALLRLPAKPASALSAARRAFVCEVHLVSSQSVLSPGPPYLGSPRK